jgi:uncharacterized protein YidB (DUF937 family)
MEFIQILQQGASIIQQNGDQATSGLGTDQLTSALGTLFGETGGTSGFGSLFSKMQAGGLGDTLASWLGKGEKSPISPDAVTSLFGSDKLQAFATQLGMSEQSAKKAIADALPEMLAKANPAGSLTDNVIGNSLKDKGLTDITGKLF